MPNQVLLLGLSAALGLLLLYWALRARRGDKREAFPAVPAAPRQPAAVVTLYWADWCPHCTAFKQTWAAVHETAARKGWPVQFRDVDCSDSSATVTTPGGNVVRGFPTVFGVDASGNEREYGGQRTAAAFAAWILELGQRRA